MALDREDTLKKAEKLLRQGRLDAAIAEYVRVVEDQPRDWNTANMLGDLYVRAGQIDSAVAQFSRIADHFMREGFYPKASALYKKILKISPEDETTQLQLAEISVRQGLLADAKTYFGAVAVRRRNRGDYGGADEIVLRLGEIDPSDLEARLAAARVVASSGDAPAAAARFRRIYDDLMERGREAEALVALKEAVRLNPSDVAGRAVLAKVALNAGDFDTARSYLDRQTAGDDPVLLLALANLELRTGQIDEAREILPKLLAIDRAMRESVMELAWTLTSTNPDGAFMCIDAIVEAEMAASDFTSAAAVLQEYVARVPHQVPALLRLVEVCVDGGLEATMYEAQALLADAYLEGGQAAEARVIAEDLVAREPWEQAHIERFRKSLVLLNVPDPDTVIAERLNGQAPFMATDPFSETLMAEPTQEPAGEPEPSTPERSGMQPDEPPAAQPASATAAPTPPRSPMAPGPMEIDLSSVLGEIAAAPPSAPAAPKEDLDQVFQEFRTEVSRQSGAVDAAQHLGLANTYLEMGMEDDAIESLKTAARSPRHRFEAGTILARLFQARGEAMQAIEWMERAAEAPAPGIEEGRALLYDLAVTLENVGETARALAVFMELQADAGSYRDVDARVDRLSRVQTGG